MFSASMDTMGQGDTLPKGSPQTVTFTGLYQTAVINRLYQDPPPGLLKYKVYYWLLPMRGSHEAAMPKNKQAAVCCYKPT